MKINKNVLLDIENDLKSLDNGEFVNGVFSDINVDDWIKDKILNKDKFFNSNFIFDLKFPLYIYI